MSDPIVCEVIESESDKSLGFIRIMAVPDKGDLLEIGDVLYSVTGIRWAMEMGRADGHSAPPYRDVNIKCIHVVYLGDDS